MESNIFVRTPTWVIPIYYEQNKKSGSTFYKSKQMASQSRIAKQKAKWSQQPVRSKEILQGTHDTMQKH